MITDDNSSPQDLIIADLKQKGMKNKDIAATVYPELPLNSAVVKVSRHLNKGQAGKLLQATKQQAIEQLGLNWHELLSTFTSALEANKTVVHGKDSEEAFVDIVPDHAIRMAAAKELIKHLPSDENPPPKPKIDFSNVDEIQALKVLFKQTDQNQDFNEADNLPTGVT